MKPLNGQKSPPLSEHAKTVLAQVSRAPVPYSEINPGIINRLLRAGLVQIVQLPSPFKQHQGRSIRHVRAITPLQQRCT